MHDTGIVRCVDDLGRIVIPMELRRDRNIAVKDPLSISREGNRIVLVPRTGIADGIVRKVDDLGRVVIPAELRRALDIKPKDQLAILTDGKSIVLVKFFEGCVLCGTTSDRVSTTRIHGKVVCLDCIAFIRE